jgi:hypothetical protein
MIFQHKLTIPLNTPQTSPFRQAKKIERGLIYQVEIQFPAGHAGLVGFRMYDGGHQIYPSNPGEWFIGDNQIMPFPDSYLKLAEPWEFVFEGYNESTDYSHTVYVRLGLADKDEFMARFLPTIGYKEIQALVAAETLRQERQKQALIQEPFPWIKKEGEGKT